MIINSFPFHGDEKNKPSQISHYILHDKESKSFHQNGEYSI